MLAGEGMQWWCVPWGAGAGQGLWAPVLARSRVAQCSGTWQGLGLEQPSCCPLQHHTSYMSSLNAFLLVFFGRPLH